MDAAHFLCLFCGEGAAGFHCSSWWRCRLLSVALCFCACAHLPLWSLVLSVAGSLLFPAFPPKGSTNRLDKLGSAQEHGSSWRAKMQLGRSWEEFGPNRTSKAGAEADLTVMRAASSREQVPQVAKRLRESARDAPEEAATRVWGASSSSGRAVASAPLPMELGTSGSPKAPQIKRRCTGAALDTLTQSSSAACAPRASKAVVETGVVCTPVEASGRKRVQAAGSRVTITRTTPLQAPEENGEEDDEEEVEEEEEEEEVESKENVDEHQNDLQVVAASSPTLYFEAQVGGWCGMHALNNYLQGPYVTQGSCQLAAASVVRRLSQVGGGDVEDLSQHLHPVTGWLSIDVINVLGAGVLGIHVEAAEASWMELREESDGAALVNWSNQHWTVLQRAPGSGAWVHTNSVRGGGRRHGRVTCNDQVDLFLLLAEIEQQCGGAALHRVVRQANSDGHFFLEREGLHAMLGAENEEPRGGAAECFNRVEGSVCL